MATLYTITDWNRHYENNRSRLVRNLTWVPVPNNHDSEGFVRIITHKSGAKIFTAWILLLQVASRCEPRGKLIKSTGEPHDCESLSLKTRAPAVWFEEALPFLVQVGWLECKQVADNELALGWQAPDAEVTPRCAEAVTEGKGREGKEEKEGRKETASPALLPFGSEPFRAAWSLFEKHRREIRKPLTPTSASMSLRMLSAIGETRSIRAIEHTIAKGWQGIREPDTQTPQLASNRPAQTPIPEPADWKSWLNHNRPDSAFAAGQDREAHQWSDLDRGTQLWLVQQMRRSA